MRVTKQSRYRREKRQPKRWLKWSLFALGGLATLFVAVNAVMWIAYRGKVLPNVKAAELPSSVTLEYQQVGVVFEAEKAGIAINQEATKAQLAQRSALPLLDVIRGRRIPVVLTVQQQKFMAVLREIEPVFEKPAQSKRVEFSGDSFTVAEPTPGHSLDETLFVEQIKKTFSRGRTKLTVPIVATNTDASGVGIDEEAAMLNNQLKTKITFTINGQAKQVTAAEMGSWYVPTAHPSGGTMMLSQDKVKAFIQGLAPTASNAGNAGAAVSYAIDKKTDITFVVAANAAVKYTYCVSGKSVADSHMPNFVAKVAATLGDPRGWNAGGRVSFERVDSGCNFTVWLSAPSQMTSFGGLCDSYYSCRSGRNVVINFDRWQGATDPWNASGGSLEDYRVMVTNHEVGHWLGFGHSNCSGPGQPAPVMQQQSISLQGCVFNPWPTAAELSSLKQSRSVVSLQPRKEYVAQSGCSCGQHA